MKYLVLFIALVLLGHACATFEHHVTPHKALPPKTDVEGDHVRTAKQRVVIHVPEGEHRARSIAESEGFTFVGEVFDGSFKYEISRSWEEAKRKGDHTLSRSDSVNVFHELVPLRLKHRGGDVHVDDRLYSSQWWLNGQTRYGADVNVHYNASGAWDLGATGEHVIVGVVDGWVDRTHDDLSGKIVEGVSVDVTGKCGEGKECRGDTHATACAGMIAAAKDGEVCGVGIAYDAKIAGLTLLGTNQMTDADEARVMSYGCEGSDIISVISESYGTPDTGSLIGTVGPLTQESMHRSVTVCRHGRGQVHDRSSGNGARKRDMAGLDGNCNDPYTACISGTTDLYNAPSYSEAGACVLLSGPTNGGIHGVATIFADPRSTDRCTLQFGGTSASAPGTAGVAALIIQANPRLTWWEVNIIRVKSAQVAMALRGGITTAHRNPTEREHRHPWIVTESGMHWSPLYGFGIPNAGIAVEMARDWVSLPPLRKYVHPVAVPTHAASVAGGKSVTIPTTMYVRATEEVYNMYYYTLEVDIKFDGQLRDVESLEVTTPGGTPGEVLWDNKHTEEDLQYAFGVANALLGHPSGTWMVTLKNQGDEPMTINSLKIVVHGFSRLEDQE